MRMPAHFPSRWNMCHIGKKFSAAVLEPSASGYDGVLQVNRRVDVPKGTVGGQEGECLLGELTDKGRETTRELGQRLRKLYVEEYVSALIILSVRGRDLILNFSAGSDSSLPRPMLNSSLSGRPTCRAPSNRFSKSSSASTPCRPALRPTAPTSTSAT